MITFDAWTAVDANAVRWFFVSNPAATAAAGGTAGAKWLLITALPLLLPLPPLQLPDSVLGLGPDLFQRKQTIMFVCRRCCCCCCCCCSCCFNIIFFLKINELPWFSYCTNIFKYAVFLRRHELKIYFGAINTVGASPARFTAKGWKSISSSSTIRRRRKRRSRMRRSSGCIGVSCRAQHSNISVDAAQMLTRDERKKKKKKKKMMTMMMVNNDFQIWNKVKKVGETF